MKTEVYVAGPLFSDPERMFLEHMVEEVKSMVPSRVIFRLPHVVCLDSEKIFTCDMIYLKAADIVLAWLDGSDVDSGTAFEIGYAYCKGKEIIGYATDKRFEMVGINKMIFGACSNGSSIFDNFEDVAKAIMLTKNE